MKPKDNTSLSHGLIVCKPLTPELEAELKLVLEAELARPVKYTVIPWMGDCRNCAIVRDRKALWFIAGTGAGMLVAAAAFVVLVLWMM